MYRAKVLVICIVFVTGIIFSLLTLESVEISGQRVYFCRNVEFWCKPSFENNKVIYDATEDKYSIQYPTVLAGTTKVVNGVFEDEYGYKYSIDLPDGEYQDLEGYYTTLENGNSAFKVQGANIQILGDQI